MMKYGFGVALMLAVLPAVAAAQAHDQCWLQYNGWLNTGTNPSVAEVKAAMQQLGAQYNIPWEVICTAAYQESGIHHFASDGRLLHNVTECKKNYQKYVLGMTVSAPTPPGLGMMQLTGGTATGVEAQPWTQIRTSWQYNLQAGVQVLNGKMNAYLASSSTPSFLTSEISANRHVIENWYMPLWRYNGYVGNYGSYANTVFSELNTHPGVLAQYLPASTAATKPATVISHFFDTAYGEAFVARADGQWTCKHGNNYTATVHLTTGGGSPPPPPPPPTSIDQHVQATTSTLNVRSGPGTSYGVVGSITNGQKYVAFQQQGSWYRIWYNGGGAAWIHSGYTAPATGNVTQVTTTPLSVRSGPGTSYAAIGEAGNGQRYSRIAISAEWLQIYFAGGTGWIHSAYTNTPVAPPPPAFPNVVKVTAASLNVRSGPGTTYSIIGAIPANQRYVAISESGNWYKIYYAGNVGWIHSGYTVDSSGSTAKVTTSQLNVRSGPGTTYSIVGSTYTNHQHVIVGSSGSWRRIYYGGAERWVYGSYTQTVTVN